LAGIAAAIAVIMAIGLVGGLFFSVEAPTDPRQGTEVAAALGAAPAGLQVLLALSWFAGGFGGAAAAKRVARLSWPGWTVAGGLALLLAGTFLVPLPVWMQAAAVIGPLAGGLLADLTVGGADEGEASGPAADARA